MFFCKLKICYYLVLIAYHGCDVCFDWLKFYELLVHNTVQSGILISTNSSPVKVLFGISCGTGTLFSIIMIVTYGYYIKFHWYCIYYANYRPVKYSDDEVSIQSSDHGCDKKCNRKFIALELWVSVL